MNLAPNGKPSNLTPEQYKLVRTPEFKEWFGDWERAYETGNYDNVSKVIDEETKEPLVVYHFTNTEFNVFEKKGLSDGFFFTKNIEDEEFSQIGWLKSQGLTYEQSKEKGYDLKYEKVKPYFLNIKQIFTKSNVKNSSWSTPYFENTVIEFAKRNKKNDGVEFLREIDNKQIIAAFYSNQIKLADGTNTTFDSNNPDIRYNKGGRTFNDKELLYKYNRGESIGFTAIAHLKAKGLIPRADGKKRKSDKYKYADGGNFEINYPLADINEWYGDSDYEVRGGVMVMMSPEDYLKLVRPLKLDDSSLDNIQYLKKHILSGKKLDPLVIYKDGKEDGRHRAYASIDLGIKKVPVIKFNSGGKVDIKPIYTGIFVDNEELMKKYPPFLLTSEQVEVVLGRKLHWWNDDVVSINSIDYKKVFLKDEYKRL